MKFGIGKFEIIVTLAIFIIMALWAVHSVKKELSLDPNSVLYEQKTTEKIK